MKKQIAISFFINICGLFSLFIIDLNIARLNDDFVISSWAITKSTLFIGVYFVLLGLDQSVIRLKSNLTDIFSAAVIQFLILSIAITSLVVLGGYKVPFFLTAFSLFLFAFLFMYYSEHRLNLNYSLAQLSLNGWKLILLLSLIITGFSNYSWNIPLAIFIILLVIFYLRGGIKIFKTIEFAKYKSNLITGLHYFIASISLVLTLYIDQLLLRFDGKITESSVLFSHVTFFISPNAILIGFCGFLLAPFLKRNPEKKKYYFKKYFATFLLTASIIVVLSYFFGNIIFSYFKHGQKVIPHIAIALTVVAFFRYLYILPSSYVGSFASNKQIRKVAYVNLIGILVYILTYFLVSRINHNFIFAIVLALICAWLIRVAIGFWIINEIFRANEPL